MKYIPMHSQITDSVFTGDSHSTEKPVLSVKLSGYTSLIERL